MSELQNPVCWGVFAKIDGQFVLQHPAAATKEEAEKFKAMFVPGMELEVKPLGVVSEAEPVAWQFYQGGKWWNGDERNKDHRKNTEAAGIPTRDLFAQQPAVSDADWLAGFAKEVQQATEASLVVIDTEGSGPDRAVAEVVAKYSAQPPVAVPDGYALVPIEPTREMLDAAERIDWSDADVRGNCRNQWNAMLAAASQAAAPAPNEEECLHDFVFFRSECVKCGLPYADEQKGGA